MTEQKKNRQSQNIWKWFAFMLLTGIFISQAAFWEIYAENPVGTESGGKSALSSYTLGKEGIVSRADRQQSQEQAEAGGENDGTVVITVDEGAVVVTVNNVNKTVCAAKVKAVAAANAVLTEEELRRASGGDVVEIRIDVEGIDSVPAADRKTILHGMEIYRNKILGLTLGMYVDVSVFKRVGGEDWRVIDELREPVEIIFDVPEKFRELSTDFYIIRAYEGESLLLKDTDDDPESITVKSECFSTYAITYKMKKTGNGAGKCGLCHMCPTFLGICCFIWLAALIAVLVVLVFLMRDVERREAEEEMEEEAEETYNCYEEWDL